MLKQKRLTVLSLAVMLALLMAAVMPMSALADDGVPPQPEAPVVVEEEPVVEEPAAEVPAAEEPAAEEPTVAEIMDQLPEDTALVVLDESGEVLPLVSAEAAEVILLSDPVYCEAGFDPGSPSAIDHCTGSHTSMTELIAGQLNAFGTFTALNPGGTFYFTAGDYAASGAELGTGFLDWTPVNLDNYTATADVTFQGGWNGSGNYGGLTGTFGLSGQTVFNLPVQMTGWQSDVTVNNFTITGANDTGLTIKTTGDIYVSDVDSSGNDGYGAILQTPGNVEVVDSSFEFNDDGTGEIAGLDIRSDGDVYLDGVMANANNGDGADIYGTSPVTGPTSVTVDNSNFNYNHSTDPDYGTGLWIDQVTGNVTLNYDTASYNSNDGVYTSADGNITLNNLNAYSNDYAGAELYAGGYVESYNGYYGDNYMGMYVGQADNVYSDNDYYYGNYYGYYGDYHGGYYGGYGGYGTCGGGYYGNYYGGNYFGYYGYGFGGYGMGFCGDTYSGNNTPLEIPLPPPADPQPTITIESIVIDNLVIQDYTDYKEWHSTFVPKYYSYGAFYESFHPLPRGYGKHGFRAQNNLVPQLSVPQSSASSKSVVANTPLTEDLLPAPLPAGKTFVSAVELCSSHRLPDQPSACYQDTTTSEEVGDLIDTSVENPADMGAEYWLELPASVFFNVPADAAADQTYTVLSWNGTEWVEFPAEVVDGKIVFEVEAYGTFALVTP